MLLQEKINLWRNRFYGRQEVFGQKESFFSKKKNKQVTQYMPVYRNQEGTTVGEKYKPMEDTDIECHIKGTKELLNYNLIPGVPYCHVRFAAMDFDLAHTFEDVMRCKRVLDSHKISCAIARSTKKGHHLYIFFDDLIEAHFVTSYIRHVYEQVGFMDKLRTSGEALPETFPKTTAIRDILSTGYGIKPPMQGTGLNHDQNCWVDHENNPIGGSGNSEGQWDFFAAIPDIRVVEFKIFLEESKIPVEEKRLSEKRGFVEQKPYNRTAPYEAPSDGDLNLVIQGCPSMKKLWNGPAEKFTHEGRVAVLSWAMQTNNGLELLRERWGHSPEAESQIDYAIKTYQAPWTCKAMQAHGNCVKGKDPKFCSGESKSSDGLELADYCFKRVPPKEVINGKVTINPNNVPETEWRDPSPIRLRVPRKGYSVEDLSAEVDKLSAEDPDIGDKITALYDKIINLPNEKARKSVIEKLKKKKIAAVKQLNAIEKEAREHRKLEKSKIMEEDDSNGMFNGTCYTRNSYGGYSAVELNNSGDQVYNDLCNFQIELEKDINIHSQLEGKGGILMGKILCEERTYKFQIPKGEWNSNPKLASYIGLCTGANAGFKGALLDKIREAATVFGRRGLKEENRYDDYGFDAVIKPLTYRTANMNITVDGFKTDDDSYVDLDYSLYGKNLALKVISPERFSKVVFMIKTHLLKLQRPKLSYTGLAHSLQSVIQQFYIPMHESPVMWIQGVTGSGKSEYARMCQSMHGNFERLLNFSSTARSLEAYFTMFKDTLLVLDDYKEAYYRKTTITLLQNIYDRNTRTRLKKDASEGRPGFCRGMVMITAEDQPTAEASTISRCILVEAPSLVQDSRAADQRLRDLKEYVPDFPGVTSRFIHWVLQNYPEKTDMHERFFEIFDKLKDRIRGKQNASRVAQNLAANFITWELFCNFLKANEMLSAPEYEDYLSTHWQNVCELTENISEMCGEEQASNVFISGLLQCLGTKRYRIEGLHGDNNFATVLGYVEDAKTGEVFVYPEVCLGAVKEVFGKTGGALSHSLDAIGKQLVQDKMITRRNNGRTKLRKRHNGLLTYVWCIDGCAAGILESMRLVPDEMSHENNATGLEDLIRK